MPAVGFNEADDVAWSMTEYPDHRTLAVLQCSKRKRDGRLPAREKYAHKRATLFRKAREYVETLDMPYIILSGKYGALLPDDEITDYDQPVSDRDDPAWRRDVLDALAERDIVLSDYDEIRLLVGKDYRDPLRSEFADVDATVTAPLLDCAGYGYMTGRLSDWTAELTMEVA